MTYITQARLRARNVYDFAVDGGAQGTLALRGDAMPSGAIVENMLIRVLTILAGATATVALTTGESAGDLLAASAISGAPWSTTGAKRGALTASSTPITLTATRTVSAVIATANLTAGKFEVITTYVVPQF